LSSNILDGEPGCCLSLPKHTTTEVENHRNMLEKSPLRGGGHVITNTHKTQTITLESRPFLVVKQQVTMFYASEISWWAGLL